MRTVPRGERDVRRTVLVVEDNADAQIITTTLLESEGYDVLHAGSVAEARHVVGRTLPDVVLLDCRLPDGDGLELARGWRRDARTDAVPIVVLTAFSARQDMEAALLAGADAFLVKPCATAALVGQLERLLADGTRPSLRMRAHAAPR